VQSLPVSSRGPGGCRIADYLASQSVRPVSAIRFASNTGSNYIHSKFVELVHSLVDEVNLQRKGRRIFVDFGGLVQHPPSWATLNFLEHNAAGGPRIADTHYDGERGKVLEKAHVEDW
jgi:hypothetical protein